MPLIKPVDQMSYAELCDLQRKLYILAIGRSGDPTKPYYTHQEVDMMARINLYLDLIKETN